MSGASDMRSLSLFLSLFAVTLAVLGYILITTYLENFHITSKLQYKIIWYVTFGRSTGLSFGKLH